MGTKKQVQDKGSKFVKAEGAAKVKGEFKTNAMNAGIGDSTVSRQWAERPSDEKFLSLKTLRDHVAERRATSKEIIIPSTEIIVDSKGDDKLIVSAKGMPAMEPTNYGFNLLCYHAKAPAGYLQRLPAGLAAKCVTEGYRMETNAKTTDGAGKKVASGPRPVKLYYGNGKMYSAMSENFGRVYDQEVVEAVMKLAGNGTGDTRWKVPGMMNWSKGTYNPFVDISKDTTTLYASDRDVFMFLVDDTHPISVGKLPNGDDDLMFRGFYVWNSEMGGKSMGISTFMLRGVCQNRNLWGVEDQLTMTIRHTKMAPTRFVEDFNKTLLAYSNASEKPILAKVKAAKALILAKTDDERLDFLTQKIGLSKPQALAAIKRSVEEEGKKPESAWDFTQGLSALARYTPQTDERATIEKKAAQVMDKVTV